MAIVLHIDTALDRAFVGLSRDGKLLKELGNSVQNKHAAFVQQAIQELLYTLGISFSEVDAIGVTSGPGSYTGLRIGMASAKGICFALGKPLLAVSTLAVMVAAAVETYPDFDLYAPMIDARREEVYTALFSTPDKPVLAPHAAVLRRDLFATHEGAGKILCFGNGADKWNKRFTNLKNIQFGDVAYNGNHLGRVFFSAFTNKQFCDLAYSEPLYVKDFFSGQEKTVL